MNNRIWATTSEQLQESAYDATTGKLTITIIKPGVSKNNRYYSPELLKKSSGIFENCKMFADHATDKESQARPEGSVKDWVATVGKPWVEADGSVKAHATVIDPAFKAKLDLLNNNKQINNMGVSIRAIGEAHEGEVGGKKVKVIESLIHARSVDFVTFAGAGGQVDAIEAAPSDLDLDVITEAQLRERRPDLVMLVERDFSTDKRKQLAKSGAAMPDGSYPIENAGDLENAVKAFGRSPDEATKAHIKSRAKSLGITDLLPDKWKESSMDNVKEGYCPPMTADEHEGKAAVHQSKADELKAGEKKDANQQAADDHSDAAEAIRKAHKSSALANLHEESGDNQGDDMINKQLAKELKEANDKVAALEATAKKATAKAQLTTLLAEAKLPKIAQDRIEKHFAESVSTDGMKEMIASEAEYIKSLGVVRKNNGAVDNSSLQESGDVTKIDEYKERQYNTYRESGLSEAEASGMSGFKPKK